MAKVKIKGRTEEESKKSQQEQKEFLRQREKRKAGLLEAGASKKEAGLQATSELEQRKQQKEQTREQYLSEQELLAQQQEIIPQLEEQRVFNSQKTAEELETTIAPEGIVPAGNIPAISPTIESLRTQATFEAIDQEKISTMGLEDFQNNPSVVSNEMLSGIIKNEVDLEVLKSGEATASKLGVAVEGIPVVGSLARKFAGGLITTPSSQVDDITSELGNLETQITKERDASASADPYIILNNLRNYEDRVAFLESKIKMLTIQSPELKSAPEEVNAIQTKIQGIYVLMNEVRIKVAAEAVSGVNPDLDKAYLTLKKLKNEKEK